MFVRGFRTSALVAATLLHLSCATPRERPPAPTPAPTTGATSAAAGRDSLTIVSNTQATLGDVQLGAGNFREGEYEGAGGRRESGPSAALWISESRESSGVRHLRVGPGTRFTAGRFSFEVVEVTDRAVRLNYSPPL